MEFPEGPSIIDSTSFLDKDDINGPGLSQFVKKTGDRAIDYALYKITTYSQSADLADRVKFSKELEDLSQMLGGNNLNYLFSCLDKLANDYVEVRIELASQLGPLARIIVQEYGHYDSVLASLVPLLDSMLEDKNHDIIKSACNSCVIIAEILSAEDRSSSILRMILRILHDEEEEIKVKALSALRSLIPLLSSDICEWFIMKEAMILASENIVKVRKAVAECIPKLCKVIKNIDAVGKLLFVFRDLVKDSIWGVRKACAENICDLFDGFGDTSKDLFVLALFLDLLKDKSNNVKQCIWLQLGPCIYKCKVTVPEEMVESYIDLSKNTTNKGEFQYHFAYYFPAVFEKLGRIRWESLKTGISNTLLESEPKSKKSLISGFHEIAKILGPTKASDELAPIYENLFSESNTTKQLALNGLGKFLHEIEPEKRGSFIKYLKVLHKLGSNWRIRLAVSDQIKEILHLFCLQTILSDFYPMTVSLLQDKVSKVRESAAVILGKIVNILISNNHSHEALVEFRDLASSNFNEKLIFIQACSQLADLPDFPSLYGEEFKALCGDKTPNIRIACARVLKKTTSDDFWKNMENILSHDFDADVRFEIGGNYESGRGVPKLKPNADKSNTLMSPMFRALYRDVDIDEVISFRPEAYQLFGYLKASVTPDVNGFVENYSFDIAQKSKMLIDF